MATLADISKPKGTAADFYDQYGPDAAALRRLLFEGGQSDIDLFRDPFGTNSVGGSDSGQGGELDPRFKALIDKGYVYMAPENGGDQGGWRVDWDKVPGGKPSTDLTPYDPSLSLLNEHAVKKDPNFGWVTPTRNVNLHAGGGLWEALYNIAPAAFIAGLGGMAAFPTLATQGIHVAEGLGQGRGFNPMSLLSLAGGQMGIPSWATSLASTGAGLARGQRPNPISAGMSLAHIVNSVGPGG